MPDDKANVRLDIINELERGLALRDDKIWNEAINAAAVIVEKQAASIHRWYAKHPNEGNFGPDEASRLDSYAYEIRTLKREQAG